VPFVFPGHLDCGKGKPRPDLNLDYPFRGMPNLLLSLDSDGNRTDWFVFLVDVGYYAGYRRILVAALLPCLAVLYVAIEFYRILWEIAWMGGSTESTDSNSND